MNDRMSYMLKCLYTDSNAVILTEITCWWCCYVHHRPRWCFSDKKKLRNLMPWFRREFATILSLFQLFTAIFSILPRFSSDPT